MIDEKTQKQIDEVVKRVMEEKFEKENHFKDWGIKKIDIDDQIKIMHPKIGEIWWVSVGFNVGAEIFGKGKEYSRPVLIINDENPHVFMGVPLTSRIRSGKYNVIIDIGGGKINTALVNQMRAFDRKRVFKKMTILANAEYLKVASAYHKLFKLL